MKRSPALAALAARLPALRSRNRPPTAIAEYRAMLADGNPAELFEAKGEELWKQKRGPKNASLEHCDLGKGPGVVKGAFVELPRYFADTERVQDLESRLLTCMETLQGFNAAEIAKTPFGRGEQVNVEGAGGLISARVARHEVQPAASHAEEKRHVRGRQALSSIAAARTTSPAPPATARTASASACRTCPT